MKKILLVDDDVEVLNINKKYFEQFEYQVDIADKASSAEAILSKKTFDAIVLDVMMPGDDGFSLCKWIKARWNTPVMFLTGKTSEDDKVNGLLLGADDYVVKPYSLRELEARIQVLIRRYNMAASDKNNKLEFPPLTIDLEEHCAYYNSEKLPLSNKELDFLLFLAKEPKREFTFEELGKSIWGAYIESDKKTIMVTASRLRKKLEGYPGLEHCIENVWSKGYKFGMK